MYRAKRASDTGCTSVRLWVHSIKAIILLLVILGPSIGFAQKDQVFWDRYDRARLHIAEHNAARAVTILEELHQTDSLDPNVSYLMGVSLIIVGNEPQRAALLFEKADSRFQELWDNPGVGPPEHLFYYLVLAYCRTGQCDLAKRSLMRFEKVFKEDPSFMMSDGYYLIDGRKWADRCRNSMSRPLEVSEILHSPDVEVRTRPHEFTTASTLYGVQVAALLRPQMTRRFDGLKNVEAYVDMNGVYRYVIGNFVFRSQAEKMLKAVQGQGYPDAFIVQVTDEKRYPMEVLTLDRLSPKQKIRGTVDYRIQLAAFRESMPDESARYYLMLDSISSVSQGDLTLLTVGSFRSYAKAVERRDEIHRAGFTDAFIAAFNEGRRIPVEDARRYLRKVIAR